jgi:hypothetical protein
MGGYGNQDPGYPFDGRGFPFGFGGGPRGGGQKGPFKFTFQFP